LHAWPAEGLRGKACQRLRKAALVTLRIGLLQPKLFCSHDEEASMTTDQQAQAALLTDSECTWQRVIDEGLREAQASLAQLAPDGAEPTQQGWQIVGRAFESGMRALQAMRV
jgi:hypothetical protein